jgi:hypothetical protein
MEFSGRLTAFPLDSLLQWATIERPTGALVIRRAWGEKWVQLRQGGVVGCASNDPRDFYGPWLLCEGLLNEAQLLDALMRAEKDDMRLGAELVKVGLLDAATVRRTLRAHIRDQVCDLFFWEHGVFYFEEGELELGELSPEPLDGLALALEGGRRQDELLRMRQVFVHDNIQVRRVEGTGEHESSLEERVLRFVGEAAEVAELHRRVQGPYFPFLTAVFDLTMRGVLEIGTIGEADQDEGRESQELALSDLLVERAAERERALARERSWLRLQLLGNLFPAWAGASPAVEDLDEAERQLVRNIDGQTPLRDAFSDEPEAYDAQFEYFQDALRTNALSLLATPLDEVERPRKRKARARAKSDAARVGRK